MGLVKILKTKIMRFKALLLLVGLLYSCTTERVKYTTICSPKGIFQEKHVNLKNIPKFKSDCIKKISPLITGNQIKKSVVMAQIILESGWLRHYRGNNILGIYFSGRKARFKTLKSCVEYHNRLMQKDRYKRVIQAKTWQVQCEQLFACGYAEDTNYSKKLKQIIKFNKLYLYDTRN